MNHSPWIYQLERTRPVHSFSGAQESDIAIIGGGISGVMSAYFILRYTDKKIILVDAGKIAHGATGHNAGQIVAYFERPFADIVREYGLELATQGMDDLRDAWNLLERIKEEAKLTTPIHITTGYAGCSSVEQLLLHLTNKSLRHKEGLDIESVLIAEESIKREDLPEEFQNLCASVPQQHILDKLETTDTSYIALLSTKKGCTNSAALCEEIVGYLLSIYPERFRIGEETPITELLLEKDHAVLLAEETTITARQVVLCTNGFEYIRIINTAGGDVDGPFHEEVTGLVGYMAGYLRHTKEPPVAISYFTTHGVQSFEPYFYVTRRPYVYEGIEGSLISVGGPEEELPDRALYNKKAHVKDDATQAIKDFIHKTYKEDPTLAFSWHGLMGYTKNGLRLIGPEPKNPVLLYNLGCNGVGILSSIMGGKRISDYLRHGKLSPSIFDPVSRQ